MPVSQEKFLNVSFRSTERQTPIILYIQTDPYFTSLFLPHVTRSAFDARSAWERSDTTA